MPILSEEDIYALKSFERRRKKGEAASFRFETGKVILSKNGEITEELHMLPQDAITILHVISRAVERQFSLIHEPGTGRLYIASAEGVVIGEILSSEIIFSEEKYQKMLMPKGGV